MTRNAEASLLAAASVLAAIGVTLANFAAGGGLDAQVALTFLVFALSFGGIHVALRRWAPSANPYLFPLAAFLAAIGFIMVYRLDPELAALQRWSMLVAGAACAFLLFVLRNEGVAMLRRYRYVFLLVAVALLLLPLLPEGLPLHGVEVFGSRLWVRIELPVGGRTLSFQPGEIAKVLLTIFLASYLADRYLVMASTDRKLGPVTLPDLRQLFPVVLAGVAAFFVLIYQRDLGASLLLFGLFIGMMYIATGRSSYLAIGAVFVGVAGFAAYRMFDHVERRVLAWLRPFEDYADSGYQIAQSLFALGSGSITGAGIGLGRPDLIPAAPTDFIFAAVGEEIGFAGSVAVIAAYALLIAAGFGIALRARDVFRKFLAAGLTLVLGMQAVLIIAGVIRLLPVTGITLPFMSYGGSSLVANMVMITLLARISHGERT
jgi:peptidoglycan glycosyltransferase